MKSSRCTKGCSQKWNPGLCLIRSEPAAPCRICGNGARRGVSRRRWNMETIVSASIVLAEAAYSAQRSSLALSGRCGDSGQCSHCALCFLSRRWIATVRWLRQAFSGLARLTSDWGLLCQIWSACGVPQIQNTGSPAVLKRPSKSCACSQCAAGEILFRSCLTFIKLPFW